MTRSWSVSERPLILEYVLFLASIGTKVETNKFCLKTSLLFLYVTFQFVRLIFSYKSYFSKTSEIGRCLGTVKEKRPGFPQSR